MSIKIKPAGGSVITGTANRVAVFGPAGLLIASTVTVAELELLSGLSGDILTTTNTKTVSNKTFAQDIIFDANNTRDIGSSGVKAKDAYLAGQLNALSGSFTGGVTIGGDLTVNGTTTTVNTANLDVTDANILVNNGGNDASSEGAGLTVERTGTNGSLIYADASATKFRAGPAGTEVDLVGTTSTQTLTNKTVVVSNNTITTAASGNLVATELNAALAEHQGDIDNLELNSVVGPGSSTDNAVARFDGTTGKLIQNSGVTISDAGVIVPAAMEITSVGSGPAPIKITATAGGSPPNLSEWLDNSLALVTYIDASARLVAPNATLDSPTLTGTVSVTGDLDVDGDILADAFFSRFQPNGVMGMAFNAVDGSEAVYLQVQGNTVVTINPQGAVAALSPSTGTFTDLQPLSSSFSTTGTVIDNVYGVKSVNTVSTSADINNSFIGVYSEIAVQDDAQVTVEANGLKSLFSAAGTSHVERIAGIFTSGSMTGSATAEDAYAIRSYLNINDNVDVNGSIRGQDLGIDINNAATTAGINLYNGYLNLRDTSNTGNVSLLALSLTQEDSAVTSSVTGINVNLQYLNSADSGGVTILNGYANVTNTAHLDSFVGIQLNPEIQGSSDVDNVTMADFSGQIRGSSTVDNLTGASINTQMSGSAAVTNFTGLSVSPQVNGTSVLTNQLVGLRVNPQSVADISSVVGVDINMNSVTLSAAALAAGAQRVGFNSDGAFVSGYNYTIPAASSFFQQNYLGGAAVVANGAPTAAFGFGTNLAQSVELHDDWTIDASGLGYVDVGFVGSLAFDTGTTMAKWTGALGGAGNPSGAGALTDAIMFRAGGILPQGGSLSVTNMYGFQVDPNLFGLVGTNLWGFYEDNAVVENHLTKLAIGTATKKVANTDTALDIGNKKMLIPGRVTTAEKAALTGVEAAVVYDTDLGRPQYYDGAAWADMAGSGGGGSGAGTNLIVLDSSYAPTNSDNFNAEESEGSWVAYADTAGTAPVDMTGGSPDATIAQNTSSPLNGSADFLMTINSGASRQGEGASCLVYIPPAYRGRSLALRFPFSTTGTIVEDDFKAYVYDVTNSAVIDPYRVSKLLGASGQVYAVFPVAANTAQIRVGIHIARTTTGAATIQFDDVVVTPDIVAVGMAGSDTLQQTDAVSIVGFGTLGASSYQKQRVGDKLRITGTFTSGTVNGSTASITLTGLQIDASKLSSASSGAEVGRMFAIQSGGTTAITPGNYQWVLFYDGADTTNIYIGYRVGSSVFTKETGSGIGANTTPYSFSFDVPIAGWSSNVSMAESSVFNISSLLANGTRVTSTPTKLGEYRTLVKDAAATTSTDNAPTAAPSASNGMRIFAKDYASAGTSGEPNKWVIFVGKNKTVKVTPFAATGRTGIISIDRYNSTIRHYGVNQEYDPTTGLLVLSTIPHNGDITLAYAGIVSQIDGSATTQPTDCYFDVVVAENAQVVSTQQPRSEVWVHTGNGYGSTNTNTPRFTTIQSQTGNAISYTDSATLGNSFIVNEAGLYSFTGCWYHQSAQPGVGFTLNQTTGTDSIINVAASQRLVLNGNNVGSGNDSYNSATITKTLNPGDVVRFVTAGQSSPVSSRCLIIASKVSN